MLVRLRSFCAQRQAAQSKLPIVQPDSVAIRDGGRRSRRVKQEDQMVKSEGRQTSGTKRRAARQMSGRGHVFHSTDEVLGLRRDLHDTTGGRAAKTLAKTDGLRVTLVLLKSGATLNPESAAGGATLHVLQGLLRVATEGAHWELRPGDLVVLEENLHEPVTAVEDAAFLVTIAWPFGAGAGEQEGANEPQ
jgi:quercetin dioxygenase-like cupin family protein